MTLNRKVTLFHSPNTRSSGVLVLLKELNAEYELQVLNMKINEQHSAEYLAINPMGQVPTLKHGNQLITELVAILLYLTELYPEANLAPKVGDPLRCPYLRWMIYYAACFDPAIVIRRAALKENRERNREIIDPSSSPYGNFDTILNIVIDRLSQGDYFLGDRFTALDILWARVFNWVTARDLVPLLPKIANYLDRINARPSMLWVREKDAEIVAAQG
jgi:glutathione S-transferase